MEIHLLQKKREYRRKEYHMVTHFTRCCGMGGNMQLISYWEHMGICMFMHIFTNTEKKKSFLKGHNGKFLFNAGEISMQYVAPSDIPPDLNSEKALSLLYPKIIREAFAIYEANLHNRSWLNEEEKKTAEWNGVISEKTKD